MKSARFPAQKGYLGLRLHYREINEALVRILSRCEFVDGDQNVVLIGGPRRVGAVGGPWRGRRR